MNPAGFQDRFDSSVLDCGLREVKEETGLCLCKEKAHLLAEWTFRGRYANVVWEQKTTSWFITIEWEELPELWKKEALTSKKDIVEIPITDNEETEKVVLINETALGNKKMMESVRFSGHHAEIAEGAIRRTKEHELNFSYLTSFSFLH